MPFCERLGGVAVEEMLSDGRPERTASHYDDGTRPIPDLVEQVIGAVRPR